MYIQNTSDDPEMEDALREALEAQALAIRKRSRIAATMKLSRHIVFTDKEDEDEDEEDTEQ